MWESEQVCKGSARYLVQLVYRLIQVKEQKGHVNEKVLHLFLLFSKSGAVLCRVKLYAASP